MLLIHKPEITVEVTVEELEELRRNGLWVCIVSEHDAPAPLQAGNLWVTLRFDTAYPESRQKFHDVLQKCGAIND